MCSNFSNFYLFSSSHEFSGKVWSNHKANSSNEDQKSEKKGNYTPVGCRGIGIGNRGIQTLPIAVRGVDVGACKWKLRHSSPEEFMRGGNRGMRPGCHGMRAERLNFKCARTVETAALLLETTACGRNFWLSRNKNAAAFNLKTAACD